MKRLISVLAAPPLALALAGCSTDGLALRGAAPAAADQPTVKGAGRAYEAALKAVQANRIEEAIVHAETAVERAPRDIAYRMLLADLYLKNGRFLSAETAFADVLRLDAGNGRALFSLALARIANGRRGEAIGELDRLARDASPADIGLAYALAGDTARAVELLEQAARHPAANGRIRQNLALAYALAGDWQRARITASQDLSPAELARRMEQWAAFVQPAGPADQVAAMLGVTPRADSGQPVRLALVPRQEVSFAAAEPIAGAAPAPVEEAAAPGPAPAYTPAPVPAKAAAARPGNPGRFVVQLAAYGSPQGVKQGWSQLRGRYGLSHAAPFSAAVTLPGKGKVHRLSVGFPTQGEAVGVCRSIKARGGSCFVRPNAGDRPLQG